MQSMSLVVFSDQGSTHLEIRKSFIFVSDKHILLSQSSELYITPMQSMSLVVFSDQGSTHLEIRKSFIFVSDKHILLSMVTHAYESMRIIHHPGRLIIM